MSAQREGDAIVIGRAKESQYMRWRRLRLLSAKRQE
jgi:hypothetical protein